MYGSSCKSVGAAAAAAAAAVAAAAAAAVAAADDGFGSAAAAGGERGVIAVATLAKTGSCTNSKRGRGIIELSRSASSANDEPVWRRLSSISSLSSSCSCAASVCCACSSRRRRATRAKPEQSSSRVAVSEPPQSRRGSRSRRACRMFLGLLCHGCDRSLGLCSTAYTNSEAYSAHGLNIIKDS